MNKQRRHIVVGGSVVTAAFAFGLPSVSAGKRASDVGGIDLHIELHAMPDRVSVRPGQPTSVWRYQGKLLRGDPDAFTPSAGGWLGPIIRARRGQRVRIDLINDLPESTIIHWHGLHVPEAMDGHPRFAIEPGERYVYEFTVLNRAGSYWFHPHPHGRTGKQVYYGLAGLFQVSDDEEDALGLPTGAQDISLVLQDRSFDDDNQLIYLSDRLDDAPSQSSVQGGMMGGRMGGMMGGGMMNRGGARNGRMGGMGGMMGMFGDEILVNGRPGATLNVTPRAYRLRLLNASNSRIYKLAWHDATLLTVIGTDGGLLEAPLQRNHVMLAPAERLDLWVDFSRWPAGTKLRLLSHTFDSGMGGMGAMRGNMMGGGALPDGAPFKVLTVRVNGATKGPAEALPQRLSDFPNADLGAAVNALDPKVFVVTMGMMKWGINGRSFEMLETTPLETVRLGTQEIWEFRNDGGAMMGMAMPHAMHVHGLQFRVLERSFGSSAGSHPESAGFIDEGWKDTVLVMPGERVRILVRFADYTGLFLYHCHMLEHEDAGLMRNYRVVA